MISWCAVLLPYFVQFYVLFVLIGDLNEELDDIVSENLFEDFTGNTTAFAVLFIYMWKDLALLYSSVWFYINWLGRREGGILGNLADAAENVVGATKELYERTDTLAVQRAKDKESTAKKQSKLAIKFLVFKVWIALVVLLYFGLTIYALLIIPAEGILYSVSSHGSFAEIVVVWY